LLRKLLKYFFLGLVLLLVFLSSALLAMRFAIRGREVHVPRLTGLTPAEAEPLLQRCGAPRQDRFASAIARLHCAPRLEDPRG